MRFRALSWSRNCLRSNGALAPNIHSPCSLLQLRMLRAALVDLACPPMLAVYPAVAIPSILSMDFLSFPTRGGVFPANYAAYEPVSGS